MWKRQSKYPQSSAGGSFFVYYRYLLPVSHFFMSFFSFFLFHLGRMKMNGTLCRINGFSLIHCAFFEYSPYFFSDSRMEREQTYPPATWIFGLTVDCGEMSKWLAIRAREPVYHKSQFNIFIFIFFLSACHEQWQKKTQRLRVKLVSLIPRINKCLEILLTVNNTLKSHWQMLWMDGLP